MPHKVLICDCDHKDIEPETKVFGDAGYTFNWLDCKTEDDVIESCKDAIVLLNQYTKLNEKVFKALPSLKCIVRYGVGYDNINVADATKYGVQVCNIPDYGVNEVAEHAFALMMCLTRKIVSANNLVKSGVWDYARCIPISRKNQITVGICGVGRIGKAFAERIRTMDVKIIAYDTQYGNSNREFPDYIEYVSFEELLEKSDIISIHCLLNKDNYHMFGEEQLAKMKKDSYIINVSRGGLIDEVALDKAISENRIAGAALDVLEIEPIIDGHPLTKHENVLITPHIAWYSQESAVELKKKCAQEAVRFLNNEQVYYPVNTISNERR